MDGVGSIPRYGSPFSITVVVYGLCFVTLPITVNDTLKLKWLLLLLILMQNDCGGDSAVRYILPSTPRNFVPNQYLKGNNSTLNKSNKQAIHVPLKCKISKFCI